MYRNFFQTNKTFGLNIRFSYRLAIIAKKWSSGQGFKQTETVVYNGAQHVYKPKTIFRRPLDALETISFESHKVGLGYSGFLMTLKSKIPLKEETVRQSLLMISQRQPLLRATVLESPNSNQKYFESVEQRSKLDFCNMDKSVHDWAAIVEELFETSKFPTEDGALWKAVLLREEFDVSSNLYYNTLAFNFSHSVIDGYSLHTFTQQLLAYIEAITKGAAPRLREIKSYPLLPSSSTLLSHKLSMISRPIVLPSTPNNSSDSRGSFTNEVLSAYAEIAKTNDTLPATKVLSKIIKADKVMQIVNCSRLHGCTVTGMLLAACHFAFCGLLKNKPLPSNLTNDIACYTNVRRDHSPIIPADYVGNHYGVLTFNLPLATESSDFWELAKCCSTSIRSGVLEGKHLEFISMLEQDKGEAFLNHLLHQGKVASRQLSGHFLSNTGNHSVKYCQENAFHVVGLYGGAPTHRENGTFANFLITLNGSMSWMTCYDSSVTSSKVAQKYSDSILATLDNAIKE